MPLTVGHAKNVTVADWSGPVTVANSTGGTTTAQGSDLARPSDWNSAHNITLSLSAADLARGLTAVSGLSLAGGGTSQYLSVYVAPNSCYEPFPMLQSNSINDAPGMGTWYFAPFMLPYGLGMGRINVFCQRDSSIFLNAFAANSTQLGTLSATASFINNLAIYSQGSGANVTRLESLWSGRCAVSATISRQYAGATSGMTVSNYLTIGMISQIDTAGGTTSTAISQSGTFSTGTTSMASTAPNSLITVPQNWFTGSVMDIIPLTTTIPAGPYWLAQQHTTLSGGAGTSGVNMSNNQTYFNANNSRAGQLLANLSAYKRLGVTTSPNSTSQWLPFLGSLATTTSAPTSNLASSDLQAFSRKHYWNFVEDTN